MTTCGDMTFERLLAHVTHVTHVTHDSHDGRGADLDEAASDLTLLHHVAFCDRCSARVLALRVQSLALAALARGHWTRDADSVSAEADHAGLCDGSYQTTDSRSDTDAEAASGRTAAGGPGACLGAVRDAGLTSYHQVLRELFMACLWGDPQRARRLADPASPRSAPPRSVSEIALDLTSLARRLNGLGLAITAEGLPSATPSPRRVAETAGSILDRLTALEGASAWVTRARRALRDD